MCNSRQLVTVWHNIRSWSGQWPFFHCQRQHVRQTGYVVVVVVVGNLVCNSSVTSSDGIVTVLWHWVNGWANRTPQAFTASASVFESLHPPVLAVSWHYDKNTPLCTTTSSSSSSSCECIGNDSNNWRKDIQKYNKKNKRKKIKKQQKSNYILIITKLTCINSTNTIKFKKYTACDPFSYVTHEFPNSTGSEVTTPLEVIRSSTDNNNTVKCA